MSEAAEQAPVKLVKMVNQIAEFFEGQGDGKGPENVREHLLAFWTQRMREEIIAHAASGGRGLSPLSKDAVALLSGMTTR